MYVQARGVAEVRAGRDSGWESQRRDDGTLPLSGLISSYGGMTFLGLTMGATAWFLSPALFWWMSPVIAGLALSMPLVALTSARRPGLWLRRRGIFRIPEEVGCWRAPRRCGRRSGIDGPALRAGGITGWGRPRSAPSWFYRGTLGVAYRLRPWPDDPGRDATPVVQAR